MLGDMRITPFYDVASILKEAIEFVGSLNEKIQRGFDLVPARKLRIAMNHRIGSNR